MQKNNNKTYLGSPCTFYSGHNINGQAERYVSTNYCWYCAKFRNINLSNRKKGLLEIHPSEGPLPKKVTTEIISVVEENPKVEEKSKVIIIPPSMTYVKPKYNNYITLRRRVNRLTKTGDVVPVEINNELDLSLKTYHKEIEGQFNPISYFDWIINRQHEYDKHKLDKDDKDALNRLDKLINNSIENTSN